LPKINTILFDWDGTLAQTLEIWLSTLRTALAAADLHPSDKQIGALFGNVNIHHELGIKPEKIAVYESQFDDVYNKLESTELYLGAKQVLQSLKADGYKLGLVSTSNQRMLEVALAANDLTDYFDVIVTADDTSKHKPDPEPINIALKRLQSTPETAIFVGDSDKDTGAALNAKLPLFLFAPEYHEFFYNLEELKQSPSVKASFTDWADFPFSALN
jgi:pyrophosphatase PpaX